MKSKKKEKKSLAETVSGALELPKSTLSGLTHIEFLSNREVSVEGYRGVLEYDENVIRLSAENMVIRIVGKDLYIKCYTPDGVVIGGYFVSLEFLS